MRAAPSIMSMTPTQRIEETCSWRKNMAARVAKTKLRAVSGQRKLMSLLDISVRRQAKNTASKNMPRRICGFVRPVLTRWATSDGVTDLSEPTCVMPFLRSTIPALSKTSPMKRINNNLAILQILITNQLDAEAFDLLLHARADECVELVSKFIE